MKEHESRLHTLLIEGLASGHDVALTKEFWSDLKSEAAQIARKYKTRKKA